MTSNQWSQLCDSAHGGRDVVEFHLSNGHTIEHNFPVSTAFYVLMNVVSISQMSVRLIHFATRV
jgi:hypothetical protein